MKRTDLNWSDFEILFLVFSSRRQITIHGMGWGGGALIRAEVRREKRQVSAPGISVMTAIMDAA